MRLTSNTGLLASVSQKNNAAKQRIEIPATPDLRCDVTPAPFMLRPYAGLYNPFPQACSVLCNHPADTEAKEFVKRAKDAWALEGKTNYFQEELAKFHDGQDKLRTPHDIVTEDMFRRYTETDSRPLTPAPTLASGKSRGSRRCLTPDQPHQRTAIVLDLRRSHSQETLYYHGYTTSDMTAGPTSGTNDRSTLPSLNLSEGAHARLIKGQCEQLPPLASPLVLSKRAERVLPNRESVSVRNAKKLEASASTDLVCPAYPIHLASPIRTRSAYDLTPRIRLNLTSRPNSSTRPNSFTKTSYFTQPSDPVEFDPGLSIKTTEIIRPIGIERPKRPPRPVFYHLPPKITHKSLDDKRKALLQPPVSKLRINRNLGRSQTQTVRFLLTEPRPPSTKASTIIVSSPSSSSLSSDDPLNQLKALNLNKPAKGKSKTADDPSSQRSKGDKDSMTNDGSDGGMGNMDDGGSGERRRGKRRRKGRQGSDRLTSAGLAAQTQQDPETQVAGIGTDSHNPSSRGSVAQAGDVAAFILPVIRCNPARKTDSFLDDDILKFLHREVDEDAIETEFDVKRRYVLEEALRTRPDRQYGTEMQTLLRELKVPAVSLGDWLHIPRVFSRKNAQFTLPIDSNALQTLTPMQYAARFVTVKKSKQLLYLTVLRKFRPEGYRMPIKDIEEGLILMMGGNLSTNQARHFKSILNWECYVEEENVPDEIKLSFHGSRYKRTRDIEGGDTGEAATHTVKYRTWCGICAVCERMYGRFPPREKDPPDGMELSDFTMLETRLAVLKVHSGLVEMLNAIRVR